MADDVTLNPGAGGDVIATEDTGGAEYQKIKLVDGTAASTTPAAVGGGAAANGLRTVGASVLSTNNSSVATLGVSATFTGVGDDVTDYTSVSVIIDASHDSAVDGMTFEFSTNDSDWDEVHLFTYTAADGARHFQFGIHAQFFRVVFTNGGTGQTHFRCQTILHSGHIGTSIHRLVDSVDPDRSATLHKSIIIAQGAGTGDFIPVQATATGNLKMSVEEFSNGVDVGNGSVGAETLRVTIADDSTGIISASGVETPADADVTPTDAVPVQSFAVVFNGATWDLVREGATAGSILVDGSNETQPVSAASLPLPSGASTSALQLPDGHNVDAQGPNAHSSTSLADPLVAGARASNSIEGVTQVSDADSSLLQCDLNGVLISRAQTTLEEVISERDTITTSTSTAFAGAFAAQGAGNHLYVTAISVANTSATDTFIDFQDGASGTVIWTMALPANGGANMTFPVPLKVADNTALAYQVGTGVTTAYISVSGFVAQG